MAEERKWRRRVYYGSFVVFIGLAIIFLAIENPFLFLPMTGCLIAMVWALSYTEGAGNRGRGE